MNQVRRILILTANPKKKSLQRLDEEVREINDGLRRSKYRHRFEIHTRFAVRLRDLRRALLDIEPHIVHFTGHGKKKGLMVLDEQGKAVLVNPDALAGLFELDSKQIECVLLNTFYLESQSDVINRHIKYVIGMRRKIKDKAAIEFAVGFYDALGGGKSYEEAFKFGRNAIKLYNIPDHLAPFLKKGLKAAKIEKNKEMVNIKILIESTREIIDDRVLLDDETSAVKNRLINQLKLPKTSKGGLPVLYKLYSKTSGKVIDDVKTLRENGVKDNEVFVLKRKKTKILKHLCIVILFLILILSAIIIIPPPVLPPEMVHIPEGNFLRGTSSPEIRELLNEYPGWKHEWFSNETPQREIYLNSFYISKFEITNKQYGKFLKDNPRHKKPALWNTEGFNAPDQPVVAVSWKDAAAFCDWLSKKTKKKYRLPTENEWEKAARGTDGRFFPWGNEEPDINKANFMNQHHRTVSVKEKAEGVSAFGLMNMAGNVWEWCNDWYILDREKVVRGGSWQDNAFFLRCSTRRSYSPDIKNEFIGFRIVRIQEN